jgi:hypothetical protein
VCTVVCRWQPGAAWAVQLLALRDELASRAFDQPGAWWPDQPETIGGRDRAAGGSWCVTDVAAGVTAVVLNRPERRTAEPGAPSRGVLPLLAARHGVSWPEQLDLTGMAGFNLVLVGPEVMGWWRFDGADLSYAALAPGVYMFTPAGPADEIDPRFADGRADLSGGSDAPTEQVWRPWLQVLHGRTPSPDPSGLIVRRAVAAGSYETVFGQFILSRPGRLRLDYLDAPADGTDRPWTMRSFTRSTGSRPPTT